MISDQQRITQCKRLRCTPPKFSFVELLLHRKRYMKLQSEYEEREGGNEVVTNLQLSLGHNRPLCPLGALYSRVPPVIPAQAGIHYGIRNTIYEIQATRNDLNYAKQTQFTKCPNELK